MTRWLDVFRYEIRQQFRRKGYLFITFGVPLLAIVIFYGYQAYQDYVSGDADAPATPITDLNRSKTSIGYIDLTPAGLFPGPETYAAVDCKLQPEEITSLNEHNGNIQTRSQAVKRISSPYCLSETITAYATFSDGQQALETTAIDVLYVIEPDYVDSGKISEYVEELSFEAANTEQLMSDYLIRSLFYDLEAEAYASLYLRLRDPAFIIERQVTKTGLTETYNEDQNFVLVYAFGLLMMISIFWGGGYLMQSVVKEKETRIIEIVLSSVQPTALLLGKTLAMGMLALLQVIMLCGTFIFIASQAGDLFAVIQNIEVSPVALALMLVYFVLGFLLFGSMMAAIGALTTSVREGQNFVVFVTLPAMIPFFFLSIFAEEPHSTLATVFSLFPFTAPLSMNMRLSVTDVPAMQIILSLALLTLGVAGTIWLSGRFFRVNTLLRGNMPTLRDLPKLFFGG